MSLQPVVISDNLIEKITEELTNYYKTQRCKFLIPFPLLFSEFEQNKKMKAFKKIVEHIHMQDFHEVLNSPCSSALNRLFGKNLFSFELTKYNFYKGWFLEFENRGFVVIHSENGTERFLIEEFLDAEEEFEVALRFEKTFFQLVADDTISFCKEYPENNFMLTEATEMATESRFITKTGRIKFAL